MVYLVLIYALIYTLGEFVSRRIGLLHSVTFAGLAVFLAAALRPQAASTRSPAGQSSSNSSPGHRFRPRRQAPRPYLRR